MNNIMITVTFLKLGNGMELLKRPLWGTNFVQEPEWWEETLMQGSRWRAFQAEVTTKGLEMGTIEFRRVEREPECLQSGEWMKTGMGWGEKWI